ARIGGDQQFFAIVREIEIRDGRVGRIIRQAADDLLGFSIHDESESAVILVIGWIVASPTPESTRFASGKSADGTASDTNIPAIGAERDRQRYPRGQRLPFWSRQRLGFGIHGGPVAVKIRQLVKILGSKRCERR